VNVAKQRKMGGSANQVPFFLFPFSDNAEG